MATLAGWKILSILPILLYHFAVQTLAEHGRFSGGSLSYTLEKTGTGKNMAKITLITGWVLGKGPCGTGCDKSDIGRSTRPTRQLSIKSRYFGNYTLEYRNISSRHVTESDMNNIVDRTYNESVIAVSEYDDWEQELLHFDIEIPDGKDYVDINFDGHSWRNVTLQKIRSSQYVVGLRNPSYHLQTKIHDAIRSDTGKANQSPRALTKPVFRVELGEVTELRIPSVDFDGDFIKCFRSLFAEGGDISMHPPPNIKVLQNCSVLINASESDGYTDDTWIAVPVSVRDYPRKDIKLGDVNYQTGVYSLSSTTVQFAVHVVANLVAPNFVNPTPEGNHVFLLYTGATWRTDIHIQAAVNRTISSLTTLGLQNEKYVMAALQQDPKRFQVKHSIISWVPSASDIGNHIACVGAIDNKGVESTEQRCFILELKAEAFNHTSQVLTGRPYFVDIPAPDQYIHCLVRTTCVIPLYVKSEVILKNVQVTSTYLTKATLGPVENVTHKGEHLYKTDLSFENNMHGKYKMCFRAVDTNRSSSEEVCIQSLIDPPDPCLSVPCFNSAKCLMDKLSGGFICDCRPGFYGQQCEIRDDPCSPDPCDAHGTVMCIDRRIDFFCYCKKGFNGTTCSESINDCFNDSCNGHGVCKDKINDFDCDCFDRFNGTRCEHDKCPTQKNGVLTCSKVQPHMSGPEVTSFKVLVGSDISLNCIDSKINATTFMWSKANACGGSYETTKGPVYNQQHAAIGDSGLYTCFASNGRGTNVTKYFRVDVTSVGQEICNFDDGSFCGWHQEKNDSFDWTLQNGQTQSDGTGPNNDHSLGNAEGRYLYIESSSPRTESEYACLTSPVQPANQTMCFEFWYYMFGDGTGGLFVFLQDPCLRTEIQVFKQTGEQGERWNKAAVTISRQSVPNDYRIIIKADVGTTYHGDTSIDDLVIRKGQCQDDQGVPIVG